MPIYRPRELLQFLADNGLSPKKVLSQNFLTDGNILKKIIKSAELSPGELVLEIGSGPGALTELLLEAKAKIVAVEKDDRLATLLKRFSKEPGDLAVYCGDIMRFPLEEALSPHVEAKGRAKVIANLPYHITTPILEELLPRRELFTRIVVMVQEEVARRLTASPGSKEYGSFTLFVNYYAKATYAFKVSRECFYPPPKVDSAIVSFALHPPPEGVDSSKFFEMTRCGFQTRRKMLKKSLSKLFPAAEIEAALREQNLPPAARPEELSLGNFLELYFRLYNK